MAPGGAFSTVQFRGVITEPGSLSRYPFRGERSVIYAPASFRRGDSDANGQVDLTDAIRILNVLFLGLEELPCPDAADSDDSGRVDLTDAVRILNVLFLGSGEIPAPGMTACGPDPTPDDTPCDGYAAGC